MMDIDQTTQNAEDWLAVRALVVELREQYPPVEDSLALEPWTCKHGYMFGDWYTKEVVCQLTHIA